MTSSEGEPDGRGEEAARLRSYFDASPVATMVITPDLTILDANAPHTAMTGRARGEIVGRFVFDAFPKNPDHDGPDTEAVVRDSIERVLRSRAPDAVPVQRHDLPVAGGGFESRYWRMTHSPIFDGDRVVAIRQDSWDVTHEARASAAAEIQRRAASTLGEIAYWQLDPESGAIAYSDRLEPMFGLAPGEAQGRVEPFRERMEQEARADLETVNQRHMTGELHRPAQREFDVILPSGERRHMALRSEAALNAEGRRVVVGTTIDVTPLRRHEKELEAALDAKAALLVEVNHRVKNSLQLVASILGIGARAEPDREVRRKLNAAAERVRAVASVHAQLYREDDVRRVDLGAQLPSFCAQLAESLGQEEEGIRLEVDIDHVRVPTETAVAVSLIVNELVTNAFKHAFSGKVRPEEPRVSVALKASVGGNLLLSVEDNGRTGTQRAEDELSREPRVGTGRGGGLGMRLISTLVAQLGAELNHDHTHGRRTELAFDV